MNENFKFESIFKEELSQFILYKRSNNYKYSKPIIFRLYELDRFFLSLNTSTKIINQEIVDKWLSTCNINNKEATKGKYFSVISQFCNFLRMNGYENIIQPEANKLKFHSEFIPYIFTDDEIKRIFNIIKQELNINNDLDTNSFYILICLYYCCGLRLSEALNIELKDYNISDKTITIVESKNNITRLIPLNDSLNNILLNYLNIRKSDNKYLFITNSNVQYYKGKLYEKFHKLLKKAKIPVRYDGNRQRIHDLRHTFAVNALKQMQIKGFDLYTSLPILSVYLGHKNIVETEYYLRLIQSEAENISKYTCDYLKNLYNKKEDFYYE